MLPAGVYLDPDALRDLPGELEVDVVNENPPKAGNFIVDAGDAFDSVCCSRGATAQTFEPTAAPESDAADRVALGAVVALLTLVA